MDNWQTNIIQQTAAFIKQECCRDASGHDWFHIQRVWQLSKYLAKNENADAFVVEMSALLHDLDDWKLSATHENLSKTTAWLRTLKLNEPTITTLCHVIQQISFKGAGVPDNELPLAGMIVQDADRLDAMGAIGIARAFAYGGFKCRLMHDPDIAPVLHQTFSEYKASHGTTINHFHEKLLLLKSRMHTETAKLIAKERHEVMEKFLSDFHQEWDFTFAG